MTIPFKQDVFYRCYDEGWGARGVYDYELSYDEAYQRIVDASGKDWAEQWAKSEDPRFEFACERQCMVASDEFDPDDWEGSDDW